jgi:hypothetical protein
MALKANSPASPQAGSHLEVHYTVQQIAQQWNVHADTIRNMFFDEPGVLKIGHASRLMGGRQKKLQRHYYSLRIPESVLIRVRDRLMHKRPASDLSAGAASQGSRDLHAS